MTNLSKELCEICGIEPLYRVEGLETLQTETTLHLIQLARKNSDFEEIDAVPIYPDFEQPENFVKLYEIISKQSRTENLNRLVRRLRVEAGWYTEEKDSKDITDLL